MSFLDAPAATGGPRRLSPMTVTIGVSRRTRIEALGLLIALFGVLLGLAILVGGTTLLGG